MTFIKHSGVDDGVLNNCWLRHSWTCRHELPASPCRRLSWISTCQPFLHIQGMLYLPMEISSCPQLRVKYLHWMFFWRSLWWADLSARRVIQNHVNNKQHLNCKVWVCGRPCTQMRAMIYTTPLLSGSRSTKKKSMLIAWMHTTKLMCGKLNGDCFKFHLRWYENFIRLHSHKIWQRGRSAANESEKICDTWGWCPPHSDHCVWNFSCEAMYVIFLLYTCPFWSSVFSSWTISCHHWCGADRFR